jgi:hypothetical protein
MALRSTYLLKGMSTRNISWEEGEGGWYRRPVLRAEKLADYICRFAKEF